LCQISLISLGFYCKLMLPRLLVDVVLVHGKSHSHPVSDHPVQYYLCQSLTKSL
jgi:hypothetical protein